MSDFPLIADHGLVGDLQTSALIATDGTVDWFCAPRFDSPSIFGSLLDRDGGHFRIRPTVEVFTGRQLYFPDTAVLVTRFMTEVGVGEVVDFMPVTGTTATAVHQLVRLVRCVRGEMTFSIEVAPRFDYGREPHQTHPTSTGVVFEGASGTTMTLHPIREPHEKTLAELRLNDRGDVVGELKLHAGQMRGVVIEPGVAGPPREVRVAEAGRLFDSTVDFWESWIGRSTYRGRWRETLNRSAITLKLMTYAPSGGIVAAPTAALPEQIGGERNWDYRYTWIRDASFSVYALLGLGFTEEAAALGRWMRDRIHDQVGGEGGPLNIMYRVDGSSDLVEEVLP